MLTEGLLCRQVLIQALGIVEEIKTEILGLRYKKVNEAKEE